MSGKGSGGKGGGGKGKKGGKGPQFKRQVPKFLQQYAHLLGAERSDPSENDEHAFVSTAIEEGYDSDGDQVVDKFLKDRQREKAAEKEAAEAELEAIAAAEAEAAEAAKGAPAAEVGASGVLKTVVFKASAKKRTAEDTASNSDKRVEGEVRSDGIKKKKVKKKLDNKKLLSFGDGDE